MSHPAHRARLPHRSLASRSRGLALAAVAALSLGLAVAVPAYADHGWQAGTGHAAHHAGSTKPKPQHPDADTWHEADAASDAESSTDDGSEDGSDDGTGSGSTTASLPTSVRPGAATGEAAQPTPAPLTPYELPFPCGQSWTGSTRPGHTPSPRAIDWNAPNDLGSPVVAAAAGTVTTAVVGQKLPSYGQYVVIDHGNGESTLYGHLDSVVVTVGQVLTQGQQLGTLGSTGNSTGPHLHFEERLNGVDQDVWLHGALFPINTAVVSANCPGVTLPVTTVVEPISTNQVPLAGNMYGSKPAETAVFKKRAHGVFVISRGSGKPDKKIAMGLGADQPVLGDWDGDGRVNPGVRNASSRNFWLSVHGHYQRIRFGQSSDLPIAGNWDGTGGWEVGVRKAKSGTFKLRAADGHVTKVTLGDADDLPVTGDWNGDGITDLGTYDPTSSVFTLQWSDAAGVTWQTQVAFGVPGDYPVAGDWDGNGVTDVGVWDPSTRTFAENGIPSTVSARAVAGRGHVRRAHPHLRSPRG